MVIFAGGGAGSSTSFSNGPTGSAALGASRPDDARQAPGGDDFSDALVAGDRSHAGSGEVAAASAPLPEAVAAEGPPPAPPVVDRPIIAPPPFNARPSRSARPPRALAAAPGPKEGGVWAVVVGIDDYPGTDADLKAAKADARDVDAALAAYGVPGNRRLVLLDQDATAANIRSSLAWLADRASADATAVFFYSGHVRQISGDVDRDGEAVDEAIVGADGDHVLDGDVADILGSLEARSTWLGIAACYGSGFDDALAPGRVVTAAAAEEDLAYENSALGHSYLVEYMVRRAMLQAKAPGSVQEAFAWARGQIARDYPNRQPVIVDRAKGPVVLGVRPGPPEPARQDPQPKPAPAQPEPAPQGPPGSAPDPAPAPPESGPPGACAQVLGVSVCSEGRTSLSVSVAWRRGL